MNNEEVSHIIPQIRAHLVKKTYFEPQSDEASWSTASNFCFGNPSSWSTEGFLLISEQSINPC